MSLEWKIETRKISDLKEYHKNPRKITKEQMKHLELSILKFGLIDKPFINVDNTILGGHQRIKILKKLGYYEIQVQVPNRPLNSKEMEELNYRHNENSGDFDYDILANEYDYGDLISWGEEPVKEPLEEIKKKKPKFVLEFDNEDNLYKFIDFIQNNPYMDCYKGKVKT